MLELVARLKTGLVAALKADAGVAAQVKTNIFPVVLPPEVAPVNYPALTYSVEHLEPNYRLEDGGWSSAKARVRISSWAQTETQAEDAAGTVWSLLSGLHGGVIWNGLTGTVAIDAVLFADMSDDYDEYPRLYGMVLDFDISFHDPN